MAEIVAFPEIKSAVPDDDGAACARITVVLHIQKSRLEILDEKASRFGLSTDEFVTKFLTEAIERITQAAPSTSPKAENGGR